MFYMFYVCAFKCIFVSNLYLYNTALFCVNKNIIIILYVQRLQAVFINGIDLAL